MKKIEWRRKIKNFGGWYFVGYTGSIIICYIHSTCSPTRLNYVLNVFLPGSTPVIESNDYQELMEKAEELFESWLDKANLVEKKEEE